eukprot:COSAG01_NODE_2240_length_8087_cov_10.836254_4_plen_157_part_00
MLVSGGGSSGGGAQQEDDARRWRERAGGGEALGYGLGEPIPGAQARGSGALPACLVGGWRWLARPHRRRCHRQGARCSRRPRRCHGRSAAAQRIILEDAALARISCWLLSVLLEDDPRAGCSASADHGAAQPDEAVQRSTSRHSRTVRHAEPIFNR